ncbi:hypothetical protein [Paucisalibacillus globulus]|uniref:hypothetical protein n=1 Tax=Paucisalibacillus globulus TaxID=351095 RepID=UPI00047A36A1|nr:hypothetical protein [Paucisalibacillus globulus]
MKKKVSILLAIISLMILLYLLFYIENNRIQDFVTVILYLFVLFVIGKQQFKKKGSKELRLVFYGFLSFGFIAYLLKFLTYIL